MKRFMLVALMVIIGSGFVACQDDKAIPPTKEKMKGEYPISSPETKKTPPLEEETTPKEEKAPAPE